MTKTISFRAGKYSRTLSDDQVISAARAAIVAGLPVEAKRYKHWAVMVDGEPVGLKWLFSHVTGIPATEFQSQYARDVLERRLGLRIVNAQNSRPKQTPVKPKRVLRGEKQRWAELVARQAKEIRDFLAGRTERRPSDVQLCDWVQFCYSFELYAEGGDLFALVNPVDVHPWHLDRTKKLAQICKLKANEHG
jgi:hypothetical protein